MPGYNVVLEIIRTELFLYGHKLFL